MQPYQEASRVRQEHEKSPFKAAGQAAGLAAGSLPYAAGGAIFQRALPFLSKYIPEDLAVKGLSKIDPRFGKFINKAMGDGKPFEEVKDFIQEKVDEGLQNVHAKEKRNIIEQYDPELHTYIQMKLKEGMSILQAGQKALGHGRFKKAVDKITKDHKTPWTAILRSVYGIGEQKKQEDPQQQEPQQAPPQQQQGQSGPMQQSIMDAIERATAARARRNAQ